MGRRRGCGRPLTGPGGTGDDSYKHLLCETTLYFTTGRLSLLFDRLIFQATHDK